MKKRRTRLVYFAEDDTCAQRGAIRISVWQNVTPSQYEQWHVWGRGNSSMQICISAIYIRKISVPHHSRGIGIGTKLLGVIRALATSELPPLPILIDVETEHSRVRAWLRREGFQESIFWSNPHGVLMVRYRYH